MVELFLVFSVNTCAFAYDKEAPVLDLAAWHLTPARLIQPQMRLRTMQVGAGAVTQCARVVYKKPRRLPAFDLCAVTDLDFGN